MSLPILQLAKDQDRRLRAGHLWIYTNEVDTQKTPLSTFNPGDLVEVKSQRNKSLGIAYINPHTLLCARLLTSERSTSINKDFFIHHLQTALNLRQNLYAEPYYRWVFSESDRLPGLIIDRFNDVIVVQANTAGMNRLLPEILAAIQHLLQPKSVIYRLDSPYRELEQLPLSAEVAYGETISDLVIKENSCEFLVSLLHGQKTGWFFDHRDNRKRITHYVKDKTVLDVFCYLGAFTMPIAKAGAKQITCIDSSKLAIEGLLHNAKLNHCDNLVTALTGDAFELLLDLANRKQQFDVILLDPPALIKKKKDYQQGLSAYEKLNQLALSLLSPNGILLTASCSMHLSDSDLLNCVRKASITVNRQIAVLEQLHQGRDHPVHPAIPETNYLKGYIVTALS